MSEVGSLEVDFGLVLEEPRPYLLPELFFFRRIISMSFADRFVFEVFNVDLCVELEDIDAIRGLFVSEVPVNVRFRWLEV